MSETILVLGGTGRIGRPVVRRLAAEGHAVRVLTRRKDRAGKLLGAGLEVFQGDVRDPLALERALEGCTAVHSSLDGQGDWDIDRRGAENLARAAAGAGVRRITHVSGASTCEENAWFPMTRAKLDAETAIGASGVPVTIFRCTMFMETLANFVREGRAVLMGDQPHAWHWVAADDFAGMVARAHATPAAEGKTLYVHGPDGLTMEQALRVYRALCAPDAQITRVPFWLLSLMARLPGREQLRYVGLPLMRYFSRVPERGDPTEADALLGKPATTLAGWCRTRGRGEPAEDEARERGEGTAEEEVGEGTARP